MLIMDLIVAKALVQLSLYGSVAWLIKAFFFARPLNLDVRTGKHKW